MIVVWISLGIVAYLLIGGILAGLFDDEDLDVGLFTAWPIVLVFFAVAYLGVGLFALGNIIANWIRKFFKS